jgi:GGDEF domain-containing protein
MSTHSPDHLREIKNAARSPHRVSYRTRQLERYIPFSLGCVTGLLLILTRNLDFADWMMVALALCIGAWSRAYPAQHQAMLLARAACLLLCAAAVHLQTNTPLSYQLLLMWTLVTQVGYSMLARMPWALLIAALGVLQVVLLGWLVPPSAWSAWVLTLVQLAVWPCVAMVFGNSSQRSDARLERSLIDEGTGLYNTQGLFTYGADLARRCRSDGQPLSLLLISCRNIDDVGEALGDKVLRRLLGEAVKGIATSAEFVSNSLTARCDLGEFVVLLPAVDAERSKVFLAKKFGQPPTIQLTAHERKITVMLDTAVIVAGKNRHSIESMYAAAQARLERKHHSLAQRQQPPTHPSKVRSNPSATPIASVSTSASSSTKPSKAKSKPPKARQPSKNTDFGNIDSALLSRFEPSATLPLPLRHID